MSTEHLKPHQFKKGQSGNPLGRPKAFDIRKAAQNIMEEQGPDGRQRIESILWGWAISEDAKVQEMAVKYAYGLPKPPVTNVAPDEQSVGAAVLQNEITPQAASAWLKIKMFEALKEGKQSMTHEEFLRWLHSEVEFDPPITKE